MTHDEFFPICGILTVKALSLQKENTDRDSQIGCEENECSPNDETEKSIVLRHLMLRYRHAFLIMKTA